MLRMKKKRSSAERNLGKRIFGVTMPIERKRIKWGRNWPCICGSNKKYKNCCYETTEALTRQDDNANVVELSEDVQKLVKMHQEAIAAEADGGTSKENGGESRYEGNARENR